MRVRQIERQGPGCRLFVVTQAVRQVGNRGALEEGQQGEPFTHPRFNAREELDRQQRVSPQLKEVILYSDGSDAQNLFPDHRQLVF
jgi:hypothetical protein